MQGGHFCVLTGMSKLACIIGHRTPNPKSQTIQLKIRFAFSSVECNKSINKSRAGAVVRALASHRCGPGLILSSDNMRAKFVAGSVSALRGFPLGTPVFPSPQKPALLNSNLTQNAQTHNT